MTEECAVRDHVSHINPFSNTSIATIIMPNPVLIFAILWRGFNILF